jgi:oxygen-independent coproporphyrinogen-3 oxidase
VYVASVACEIAKLSGSPSTIYFGGGSPALCNLVPLANPLSPLLSDSTEFTVELHPLDVTQNKLCELKSIGVNRVSMGVQSLDNDILRSMNRNYSADDAKRAFSLVKSYFDNAGIDLIVGYPGEKPDLATRLECLKEWGLSHCSVYSLQNERGLKDMPDDDVVLDRIREVATLLKSFGLERYEISNYAVPGCECRHNLAVWRGEDYIGLGEGACGRIGLSRTRGVKSMSGASFVPSVSSVTPEFDLKERTLFRLRTREGIDTAKFPEWREPLDRLEDEGLVVRLSEHVYRLTERGTEVCDSILAELA